MFERGRQYLLDQGMGRDDLCQGYRFALQRESPVDHPVACRAVMLIGRWVSTGRTIETVQQHLPGIALALHHPVGFPDLRPRSFLPLAIRRGLPLSVHRDPSAPPRIRVQAHPASRKTRETSRRAGLQRRMGLFRPARL